MVWLVGFGVLCLLIFVPVFRKIAVGVFIVAAIAVYLWVQKDQRDAEREKERSRRLIGPSEVEFVDMRLDSSGSYSRHIFGRVRNNSREVTLRNIGLTVVVRDCSRASNKESVCDVVGETSPVVYLNIPPGQARDFRQSLSGLSDTHIRGVMSWNYRVDFIEGEQNEQALSKEFVAYRDKVHSSIRANWVWHGPKRDVKALAQFEIKENGAISDAKIAHPSGDSAFDDSILRAIQNSSPLPPPPVSERKAFSRVEMNFQR